MRNKNKKFVKGSKTITQQPKTIENPSITDIKSFTIAYPKNSYKLYKTIKQTKKVSQVGGTSKNSTSTLYSKTKK